MQGSNTCASSKLTPQGCATSRYSVQCGPAHRELVGPPLSALPAHMRSEGDEHQGYSGYDVFAHDPRTPDFTNCTSHPGRTHLHRQCHTKSIVRPALVELQHAHQARPCIPALKGVAGPTAAWCVGVRVCNPKAGHWPAHACTHTQ